MFNSISLTVYNRARLTEFCINSILETIPRNKYEFIVVDNGSQPDTIKMLKRYEHHFDKLVLNHRNNLGSSINDAWKLANPKADWLIVFSNDVFCMKGWYENFELLIDSEFKPDMIYCNLRASEMDEYVQHETKNFSTYKGGHDGSLWFGGGLAIKKHIINATNLRFVEGNTVWTGSIYSKFGKAAHDLGLNFIHLGKPCILSQDCEFANPEYAKYYEEVFSFNDRKGPSKLYSDIPKWKSLQIRGGYIQHPDLYYEGSGYNIGTHYMEALRTEKSKIEFDRIRSIQGR